MNYILSFLFCILGTIASALQNDGNTYWLLVSDANVFVFLFMAWCFGEIIKK